MKTLLMALVAVGLMAGPAFAFRCPVLVKQIDDEAGNRWATTHIDIPDVVAETARALAADGTRLHQTGKHVEAMGRLEEAFKLVGLAFPRI